MTDLLHFNVVCSDFDASYEFYTQVVGMKPLTSSSAGTVAGDHAPARTDRRPGEGRTAPGDGKLIAELLGFEGTGEFRGCFLYFGSARGGAYLDLLEWRDPAPPVERSPRNVGLARVAIRVDDLDEQQARLERFGVPTVSAPVDLVLGVTRIRAVCFRDPDGVLLEYVEFRENAWGG